MDFKDLTCFAAIVEEGTISGAAQRLHIAHPALSLRLKALEEDMGLALLERGARSVSLTEGGRLFYRRALRMLELAGSTRQELADVRDGAAGTLRLGTVSSSAPSLLSGRINRFHTRYPQVRFELHEGNTFELIELLHTGIIDLAIVRTPFKAEGTGQMLLPPEPMAVALRGPLAESGRVPVRWLKGKPLIFYRRFEGLIQAVCRQEGFEPEALCINDDARTCIMWAQAGLGAAITPLSAAKVMAGEDLRLLTLEHPDLYTSIAAIWKKDGYLSAAAQRFLEVFGGP